MISQKETEESLEAGEEEAHRNFLNRFRLRATPTDIEKIDFAHDLAEFGHSQQFRDSGEKYFTHVRATAIILVDELQITDVDLIIAALLHDMLEDNHLLTSERIRLVFGDRVSMFVSTMTKPKKSDPRFDSDRERHLWYFEQIKSTSPEIKLLKLADRLQNMRTLGYCDPEKQNRKIVETIEVYVPLITDIAEEYPDQATYIFRQMNLALKKFGREI